MFSNGFNKQIFQIHFSFVFEFIEFAANNHFSGDHNDDLIDNALDVAQNV